MTHAADASHRRPAMGQRRFGRFNLLGLWTLYMREVRRFTSVWTQTLLAPVVTASLFMGVFTLALSGRRGEVWGLPFEAFLAPGIVMMTVIQNAFANTSSSIMISKVQGNIVDTLMPPLSPGEILLGYAFGGTTRGLLVAFLAGAAAFSFAGLVPRSPLWLLWFAFAGAMILSLIGILAGIAADKFDQMAAITNFIVTPLSFLSGTFYSVSNLPPAVYAVSHANPVFYLIDGFRHGALGVSDASPWLGFAISVALIAGLWMACWKLLASGWKLKA